MQNYTRQPEREVTLPVRLPLIGIPNQRGADSAEDSRLVNGYAEQGLDGRWHVFKRPGMEIHLDFGTGTRTGRGLFFDEAGLVSILIEAGSPSNIRLVNVYREATLLGQLTSFDTGGGSKNTYHFNATSVFTDAEDIALLLTNGATAALLAADGTLTAMPFRDAASLIVTCGTVNGSPVVTMLSTSARRKYDRVSGTGIPADTEILSIDSPTQVTLTNDAAATNAAVNLTFTNSGPPNRDGTPLSAGGFLTQQCTASAASLNRRAYMVSVRCEIGASDVDDPQYWDWLNSIFAYATVERAVGIASQLSTIVVFKQTSAEFFRDVGTTPTNLGRVEGLRLDVGLQDVNTLCEADDSLIWSAKLKVGQRSVWMMTKLQAREVSTPAVRRILTDAQNSEQYGMVFSFGGHTFYVIRIAGQPAPVYDITSGLWYYWTALGEVDWPFVDAATGPDGTVYLQHYTNGKVYKFNLELAADDGERIDLDIYPAEFDGGFRKAKYLPKMYVNADQMEGSELKLRVSDDNQKTWSDWRFFDLSHERPALYDCGSFTKRYFHFRHSAPTKCRVHEVELHIQEAVL